MQKRRERGGIQGICHSYRMEEDVFVFSGEQLALVFQFQLEESATVKEYKDN